MLVDSGIRVGAGSDSAQISTLNPWNVISYMVTGKGSNGTLINDGQQLTRMEAIRLYTVENGWFLKEEDRLGSIEPGKLADLVVLSEDYFDSARVPDEAIRTHAVGPDRRGREGRARHDVRFLCQVGRVFRRAGGGTHSRESPRPETTSDLLRACRCSA